MKKKCQYCGTEFIQQASAQKYCSRECAAEERRQRRQKYNRDYYQKTRKQRKLRIKQKKKRIYYKLTCKWCGKSYTRTNRRSKYCCAPCKVFAHMEQNLQAVRKYQRRYQHSEKQGMLGNSNLKGEPKADPVLELQAVQNEKKRLGI
ncbi:MAG: hypothetical protein BZ138_05875 [Methanosphaera sp. rholeuAM270]|nr:MAG: hypothetical protein BZ138_05875 [Methanosphaera sp. rholeuAM270]